MQILISIFLLSISLFIQDSHQFIVQASRGYRKCFKAEQSPDKTLQAKFGFPRRQKQNCDVLFSVDLIDQGKFKHTIYSDMHKCHEMNPGQLVVAKHTSESYSIDGNYHICVEVLDDKNEQLMLEIFIGQKLNPMLYGDGQDVLPLIESQQLIDLDLKVQSIRKSLGWSRKFLAEGKQNGDKLEAVLSQLNSFTITATIVQIVFLIVYGVVWVMYMKQQKAR